MDIALRRIRVIFNWGIMVAAPPLKGYSSDNSLASSRLSLIWLKRAAA
jgi:hypothetical protein